MKKYLIIGAVAVVAVVVVAFFGFRSAPKLGSYYSSVGAIFQTDPTFVNVLSGLTVVGNLTQGSQGFTTSTTSTTLTPTQFLAISNYLISNTTANVTTTLPAATSTWAAAGSPAYGGWQMQFVTNDSTNTATFVPGTGMTFKCETNGVGTTTVTGTCTSTLVTLNATSTVTTFGYWDNASSSFVVVWGNEYH